MPRPGLRFALSSVLATALASGLAGCAGSSDPTTAVSAGATGTYIHATFTLLDTAAPCIPGVACAPEFFSCDGTEAFTIPHTWTLHADEASAGGVGTYSSVGGVATFPMALRGTDVENSLSVSLEIRLNGNTATRTWTGEIGATTIRTFANVDSSCTDLNATLDPLTLFGYLDAEPSSVTIDDLALTPSGDIQFATRSGANLSADHVEGRFSFVAANRQEFGQVFIGRIRVDGCFRVQLPEIEQAVELDPSVTAGCP